MGLSICKSFFFFFFIANNANWSSKQEPRFKSIYQSISQSINQFISYYFLAFARWIFTREEVDWGLKKRKIALDRINVHIIFTRNAKKH